MVRGNHLSENLTSEAHVDQRTDHGEQACHETI
jgi:hypothetical protein